MNELDRIITSGGEASLMAKRYEIAVESWALIADLFIAPRHCRRPRADDRLMLNSTLWDLSSGAAWRAMPERFGTSSTVYQRFRDRRNQGSFDQVLKLRSRLRSHLQQYLLCRIVFEHQGLPILSDAYLQPILACESRFGLIDRMLLQSRYLGGAKTGC
jgi:transposase